MGTFNYGVEALTADFSDDLLAHLQALISAKLRRSEGFMLTWTTQSSGRPERVSVWIEASIPVAFRFDHPPRRPLDPELLQRMSIAAISARGLDLSDLMPPPAPPSVSRNARRSTPGSAPRTTRLRAV